MNKAALYQRSNAFQRKETEQVLHEFSSVLNWQPNDSLLDIGCGSGNVTVDLVFPKLPADFKRLVGCDLSKEMVEHARENYPIPKVSFEEFNLGIDVEKQSMWKLGQFDHITSFFCLMWVRDQQTAAQNFNKLLKPGGDLLVAFMTNHPLYDFYKKQSKDNRWAEYMTDVDEFITPYQYSKNAANEFSNLLKKNGFTDINVELREKCFTFTGIEMVEGVLTSVNPFLDRMAIEERKYYIDDLVDRFVQNFTVDNNSETMIVAPPYTLLVAYAKKSAVETSN